MKTFLRSLGASIAFACLALCAVASMNTSANAAAGLVSHFSDPIPQTIKVIAFGDVTASSTFATTAYADLAGSNVTYVPTLGDCTTAARIAACLIKVTFSLDVSKATATTGTCAPYVNGAVIASAARTASSSGGNENIGGTFIVANSTVGSQTIKLQCKSGDTNALTVNFGHVVYEEIIPPASH